MGVYKIAYLSTPVEFGGAEKVSLNFLKNVDRDRFHISPLLLIRPWEKENIFIQELEKEGYVVYKVPVAIRPPHDGTDYLRVVRCFRLIHSILLKGSFALVHTNGYFADIIGIPAARKLRIPVISTCHGFISNDRNLKIYNTLDRIVLRFSRKIIAVSEGIKNDLLESGIKESRIKVIQNAVHKNSDNGFQRNRQNKRRSLNINEKEFAVGYIGRLSEEKGIKYLIEAVSMLNVYSFPVKVVIIGDGPEKGELEDLVKKRGIEEKVIFLGFRRDVENWIPAMDVFVLPSLTEGTPMSLLEAMACGIPVVASDVGGVPNVIDSGKNGILVQPGNPEEIKNTINDLYRNTYLRNSLSVAALKTIKSKYNIRDWINKMEIEYMECLKV